MHADAVKIERVPVQEEAIVGIQRVPAEAQRCRNQVFDR